MSRRVRPEAGAWFQPALLTTAVLFAACGAPDGIDPEGSIPFTPSRPTLPAGSAPVAPYTGLDTYVLEAQSTYRTGIDLQRKLVLRTCGPTNGVCHNQKEYPDLHTEATFTAAIGAPCNVQPGSASAVFDRCERLGDRFRFRDASWHEIEVGYLDYVQGESPEYSDENPPTVDSVGLHVTLHDPLPGTEKRLDRVGLFIRNFINEQGNVEALPFASYNARWWVLGDRRHLMAEVRSDQQQQNVDSLVASGIVQGDHNRNGVFGARQGNSVTLLNPGKPEESYLVGRLRGEMQGQRVLGSRMPLANQPPSVADMLALMCFIEGLEPAAAYDLEASIDYNNCSYIADPQSLSLFGSGTTWHDRIYPLLSANCGGCHGGSSPEAGLDLSSREAYAALIQRTSTQMDMKLINPGDPEQSYLYRKIAGETALPISGNRMPWDDFSGWTMLPAADIADVYDWIVEGAQQGNPPAP